MLRRSGFNSLYWQKTNRFYRGLAVLLVGIFWAFSSPRQVRAFQSDFAPCPPEKVSAGDPSGRVVVSILEIKPHTDLEGDDDFALFYDNHADIFGRVTIDGVEFGLPKKEDSDSPHWDKDGSFVKAVSSGVIPILITIKEDDEVLTGDDDTVDINRLNGTASLDFSFDVRSLQIESNALGRRGIQEVIQSEGTGDDGARIRFTLAMEDGRPVTVDDLALVEADLIQVVQQVHRLIAGKPTILRTRIANNYASRMSTSLKVQFHGFPEFDRIFPVEIDPREVKTFYFFRDSPLVFPRRDQPYTLAVNVSVVDPESTRRQPPDPRNHNDGINQASWKIVTTRDDFVLLWSKVVTPLDLTNLPSDAGLATIRDLGTAFIKATYPVADLTNVTSAVPIPIPTPSVVTSEWLATIAAGLGVKVDALLPFAFLFELNVVAGLLPSVDRLMGVLPNNWFDGFIFDLWEGVNGLSLTEYSPHAVIFLSSHNGNPAMTLPGHELGHTFSLSTDPTLKSWVCDTDVAELRLLLCGALGGIDEYKHADAAFKLGNPSRGFWVRRGDEPAQVLVPGMVDAPQCDSHCLMGTSIENSHVTWSSLRWWIDAADYDHLIDKLSIAPDPELVFVSGMISRDDRIVLGPWYHFAEGIPDRDDNRGLYVFRFLDHGGATLKEVGLPLNRSATDVNIQDLPITFFGLRLSFPEQTKSIEIWNRMTGRRLAVREVSPNVPTVQILSPRRSQVVMRGVPLSVRWRGQDADRDKLTYAIQISPDGKQWWPVAHQLTARRYRVQTNTLPQGEYFLKVLVHDGIHIGESQITRFIIRLPQVPRPL